MEMKIQILTKKKGGEEEYLKFWNHEEGGSKGKEAGKNMGGKTEIMWRMEKIINEESELRVAK